MTITRDEAIEAISEAHEKAVRDAITELVDFGYDAEDMTTSEHGDDESATHVIWSGARAVCVVTTTVRINDDVVLVELDTTFIPEPSEPPN